LRVIITENRSFEGKLLLPILLKTRPTPRRVPLRETRSSKSKTFEPANHRQGHLGHLKGRLFFASSCFDLSGGARNIGTEYGKLPKQRGLIVQTGYVPSSFATKAIFFLLAALVVVFAAMLVLTVLHP
jgi:hypothetical protein